MRQPRSPSPCLDVRSLVLNKKFITHTSFNILAKKIVTLLQSNENDNHLRFNEVQDKAKRPPQLDKLFPKINDCLEQGDYRPSRHAIERELERKIDLLDVLCVLKNGYHEKQKTSFDVAFQTWK